MYSIILFSTIIILMYFYIIFDKLSNLKKNKSREKYYDEVTSFMNSLIRDLKNTSNISEENKNKFNRYIENKECMNIMEDKIIYYIENLEENLSRKIIDICENSKIIDFEIEKLNSKDIHKKALACKKLGELRSKKSVKHLLEQLKCNSPDVKYNVFLAISRIGDEEAFIKAFKQIDSDNVLSQRSLIEIVDSFSGDKKYVYKKMIHDKNEFIACVFMKSAANFKDLSLSKEISKYLKDPSKEKRIASIKAIGGMKDKRYINDIIDLLDDKEWEVRAMAAKILGDFKDKTSIKHLTKALSDDKWFVRYNAAFSILTIDDKFEYTKQILNGNDELSKEMILYVIESRGLHEKFKLSKSRKMM